MMTIRKFEPHDLVKIIKISKQLHPKWFDKKALKNIAIDVKVNNCLVAFEDEVLGFIVFHSSDGVVKINWIAVDIFKHRGGIGKDLLLALYKFSKGNGAMFIELETVVEQSPKDGSYDETMKFYLAQGFVVNKKGKEKNEDGFRYRMGTLRKDIR